MISTLIILNSLFEVYAAYLKGKVTHIHPVELSEPIGIIQKGQSVQRKMKTAVPDISEGNYQFGITLQTDLGPTLNCPFVKVKSVIMIDKILLLKFIKFCAVGFSGMVIDFGTTWLLKEKAGVNKYIANSAGFILAATSNYIWNRLWTFQSENNQIAFEYLSFIIISVIGLGINNLVVFIFSDKLKFNFYFSKLIAIGVVTIWNFIMNYLITFR